MRRERLEKESLGEKASGRGASRMMSSFLSGLNVNYGRRRMNMSLAKCYRVYNKYHTENMIINLPERSNAVSAARYLKQDSVRDTSPLSKIYKARKDVCKLNSQHQLTPSSTSLSDTAKEMLSELIYLPPPSGASNKYRVHTQLQTPS